MRRAIALAGLAALGSVVCWSAGTGLPGLIVKDHADFEWKTSGTMPPGTEYHLLYEDPKTHAVQLMARFKAKLRVPVHHNSHDKTMVVIRGKLGVDLGSGERILGPGSFIRIPAKTPHSTRAAGFGGCEMLVLMTGPYDVLGLEPAKAK
ncbi:MAG: cupin domain-containing protein [Elusimicrobiota bacterium]|jgi:quercetin dioxygenase-like cupin family protein